MSTQSAAAATYTDDWLQSFNLTAREIDVLACLMDQKSSKKIAAVLDIKQKTVESHIFNIMQKLDKHSRSSIIDAMKKSPSIHQLAKRHHELETAYEFKETLQKIKQRVPCKGVRCKIECQDDKVKQQIESDLKVLNILCFDRKKEVKTISADIHDNYQVTFFEVLNQLTPHPLIEEAIIRFKHAGGGGDGPKNVVTHIIQTSSKPQYNLYLFAVLSLILVGAGAGTWYFTSFLRTMTARSDFNTSTASKLLERPQILSKIRALFQGDQPIKVVALVGLSGMGKTTLAEQYAMTQKMPIVWEVHAENQTSLIQSFYNLAYALSNTKEEKADLERIKQIQNQEEYTIKLMFFVKQKLKQSSKGWLLLFDNVESLKDIEAFLPTDEGTWGRGQVLITTKNNRIGNHNFIQASHVIELSELSELTEKEKLELFAKVQERQIADQKSLAEFLQKIPPFPLDVFTAAYYIKNTGNSYDEYLNLLGSHQKDESYFKEIGYYGKTRHQIMTSSIDQILQKNKEFQKLLWMVSLLNNYDIRVDFLKKVEDPKRVDTFIQKMSQFSLLTCKTDNISSKPLLQIHQSTQKFMLDYLLQRLSPQEQTEQIKGVTDVVYDSIEDVIKSNDISRIRASLLHLSKILEHPIITGIARAKLETQLGKLYFCVSNAKTAKEYLEKGISILEASPSDLPKLVSAMVYCGAALDEFAEHDKAKELLEKAVSLYQGKLTNDKEGLALALLYLGKTYSQIREAEKSKEALQQSIELYTKYGKNKESELAKAVTLLAETYMYAGDYRRAEQWFKKNEALYSKINKNHPQILWNNLRLGRLYIFTGQPSLAKDIFEKGVAALKSQFPQDKDKLGWNITYLGEVYRLLGLFDKAKATLLESLAIYKELYGPDHTMTAWIETYLGWFYYDSGQYKDARVHLEKSLEVHKQNYGDNRKRYVTILHALANTYAQLDNWEAADSLFKQCLETYEAQFGKEHTQYALVLGDYGHFLIIKKEYALGEQFLNQALVVLEKAQHGESYRYLEYLGDLYDKKGQEEPNKAQALQYKAKSAAYYKQALALVKTNFSKKSEHGIRINNKLKAR